eukprot:gene279-6694_t
MNIQVGENENKTSSVIIPSLLNLPESEGTTKPLISPRNAVPNPTKKPSKRNSLEGNILSIFSNQTSKRHSTENVKNFVDLTITNICLVDFPKLEKDLKCTINLIEQGTSYGDSKVSVIKKDETKFKFFKAWSLDKEQTLTSKVDIIISDTSKLSSKVYSSIRVDLMKDLIETEAFQYSYSPFYEDTIDFDLELMPNSKIIDNMTKISLNFSLTSYSFAFESYLLKNSNENWKKIIFEKLNSKIKSALSKEDINEIEINFIGRIHDQLDFKDVLNSFKTDEKYGTQITEILKNLSRFKKNQSSRKYQIIPEELIDLESNSKEEEIKSLKEREEDLKDLEIYEKNGFDKSALNKEEYILNMIRLFLTYKNTRQAQKFLAKNLVITSTTEKIKVEDYGEKLEKAVELYNAMILVREKEKILNERK